MVYNTEKRSEITKLISENADKVFTIDEICEKVTPDGHGKSSVYRIISKMTEEGIIRRISDGKNRHVTYQYLGGTHCSEHLHLKCKSCGKLIHLDEEISHLFENKILSSRKFLIDGGATLFGKCELCLYGRDAK